MSDFLERVALTEAQFRADVISGLRREAERLRDHRVMAVDRPEAATCLDDLAAVLTSAAAVLQAQDGRLNRAIDADLRQPWSVTARPLLLTRR